MARQGNVVYLYHRAGVASLVVVQRSRLDGGLAEEVFRHNDLGDVRSRARNCVDGMLVVGNLLGRD